MHRALEFPPGRITALNTVVSAASIRPEKQKAEKTAPALKMVILVQVCSAGFDGFGEEEPVLPAASRCWFVAYVTVLPVLNRGLDRDWKGRAARCPARGQGKIE